MKHEMQKYSEIEGNLNKTQWENLSIQVWNLEQNLNEISV